MKIKESDTAIIFIDSQCFAYQRTLMYEVILPLKNKRMKVEKFMVLLYLKKSAAYGYDEPCDVVILAVRVDNDGRITIIGNERNDRGNEHELMSMIYLPVTLISLRRKLSDENKGTGATVLLFCSFVTCSLTV